MGWKLVQWRATAVAARCWGAACRAVANGVPAGRSSAHAPPTTHFFIGFITSQRVDGGPRSTGGSEAVVRGWIRWRTRPGRGLSACDDPSDRLVVVSVVDEALVKLVKSQLHPRRGDAAGSVQRAQRDPAGLVDVPEVQQRLGHADVIEGAAAGSRGAPQLDGALKP